MHPQKMVFQTLWLKPWIISSWVSNSELARGTHLYGIINGQTMTFLCKPVPHVNILDTYLQLCDLYHQDMWHFENLATVLPSEIKSELQNQIINENLVEIVIWGHLGNDVYTSSSPFKWLNAESPSLIPAQSVNLSWDWSMKLPKYIIHFLWLTFDNSLPINIFSSFQTFVYKSFL